MLLAALFLAASIGIVAVSWRCLHDPHCHGFYRFFAFEFIVALILLNARYWFSDPLGARQIVSWVLLSASIWPPIASLRLLRSVGRPAPSMPRDAKLAFENTTALVTVGLYRSIRHPMYASLFGLGWGAYLKHPSVASTYLVLAASAALLATALAEERENLAQFGPVYADYMKTTRRFIPYVF